MPYYYIEKDGKVFLIRKDGVLVFPEDKGEIPFNVKIIRKMPLPEDVWFCEPVMDRYPEEWFHKDDLCTVEDADKIVKKAINLSYLRHSVQAIIPKGGKVLVVKAARGLTKGFWNLPGGFVVYGESPEQSVVREVREETGLDVRTERLSGIYTHTFKSSGYYMTAFTYICKALKGGLKASEEIKQIAYMDADEAIRKTKNVFCKRALEDFIWMSR